ncbi:MAG: alpha/beta fold hydrolase [Defluviitaleaceae bacterium]|nr:alpha/beta fold hydrolase [Defluviitaleaceae bacterium]
MKKRYKFLLGAAAVTGAVASANYLIFKLSNMKAEKTTSSIYKWRYGAVRYHVTGSGDPVVLIHNTFIGASSYEWEKLVFELSQNYKVYTLDLLGFGESSKPNLTYSSYLYATLINDFIEDVVGRRAYAIASNDSCGYLVSASSISPETFRKIMLISPSVGENKNPLKVGEPDVRKIINFPIFGTLLYNLMASKYGIKQFLNGEFCDKKFVTKEMIEKHHKCAHHEGSSVKTAIASLMAGDFDISLERQLGSAQTPIHVAWGTENVINPIDNFENIKEANDSIELSKIEDSKSFPHIEKAEEFGRICKDFFV